MLNVEIPDELRLARRRLESVKGYELLKDLYWDQGLNKWVMQIRLTCNVPVNDFVPSTTEWHIVISPLYPNGSIQFFPDKQKGILYTFQHQNYNNADPVLDWRKGDPCLKTSQGSWGRKIYDNEPQSARERLKWHILRCIAWIDAAATNTLCEPGDPFEFPPLPSKTSYRIAFNEGTASFKRWSTISDKKGTLELKKLGQQPEIYVVLNFREAENNDLNNIWGKQISEAQHEDLAGIWVMIQGLPVLKPWQIPKTFSELFKVCKEQGIDLKDLLIQEYVRLKKNKKILRFIALGFPVSKTIGEDPSLIHWYAFELPNPPKTGGFQPKTAALHIHQANILLSEKSQVKWIQTENWNKQQLTTRGILNSFLTKSNILLIGAGAIGSVFAELITRLGCERMTIVDDDEVKPGNLSRHTLTLNDVGQSKSEALSKRLNSIFPFTSINFEKGSIQQVLHSKPKFFNDFDVIIDATADDPTLIFLSANLSHSSKPFISISSGFNAERLFCFIHLCDEEGSSIESVFTQKSRPWLERENISIREADELIEGIGCWHPLFPARLDDIQMLVSAAVKVVESDLQADSTVNFTVIEKQYDENDIFTGIKIIKD